MNDPFHIQEVRPQELMRVLLTYFSRSQNISPYVYRYKREESSFYIDVVFSENSSVRAISPSKEFPLSEISKIEEVIRENLINDHGDTVGSINGFCDEKITGFFKYLDLFQIIPLPNESPKPEVTVADHPFIFEMKYKKCPDVMIDNMRKMEKAITYSRIINQLSNQHIWLGPRYGQFTWVLTNTEDLPNMTSKWSQVGYVPKGLVSGQKTFSQTDKLALIERVSYKEYYSSEGRSSNSFKFPDNIEESLQKAFSLSEENWHKFFMAASWFAQYFFTWQESHSSAFIALVTALECLGQEKEVCKCCNQPILKNKDICDCCGQPRYRITKHFQEFLKEYAPFIDQFPQAKKTIYQIRSQLAHGMDLLNADLEPWNFMMDAKQEEQNKLMRDLFFIARVAIYNWLQKA